MVNSLKAVWIEYSGIAKKEHYPYTSNFREDFQGENVLQLKSGSNPLR